MHVSESRAPDEPGELDEDIEEAVEEGLHGVAEALAHGHEREQEVAAAGGRQVRQRRRHHRRGGTRRRRLRCTNSSSCRARAHSVSQNDGDRAEQLRFRVLRSFRGRGGWMRRARAPCRSRGRGSHGGERGGGPRRPAAARRRCWPLLSV